MAERRRPEDDDRGRPRRPSGSGGAGRGSGGRPGGGYRGDRAPGRREGPDRPYRPQRDEGGAGYGRGGYRGADRGRPDEDRGRDDRRREGGGRGDRPWARGDDRPWSRERDDRPRERDDRPRERGFEREGGFERGHDGGRGSDRGFRPPYRGRDDERGEPRRGYREWGAQRDDGDRDRRAGESRGRRPGGPFGARPYRDRPAVDRAYRERHEDRLPDRERPGRQETGEPDEPDEGFGFREREAGAAPSRGRDRGPWRTPRPGDRGRGAPPRASDGPPWTRHPREAATDDAAAAEAAADLVEDDAEVIAGRRPVEEAFAARRAARRLLVVPQRRAALEAIVIHATTLRLPVVEVEGGTLTSLAGFDGHQGIALVVEARSWASVDDVLARARAAGEPAFVLVLDSLEDPQNMGTLLRAAEAAGVHGVIFPTRRAAPLTPAAVKASAGAVEHLLLVPVDDLPGALADLHRAGVRVVGAEAEASLTHREADLRGPLALVVGSEGRGLGAPVRRRLDLSVRIPMRGRVGSLNAAVAGSILLFEAAGQRELPAREPRAPEAEGVPDAPTTAEPEATAPAVVPSAAAAEPEVTAHEPATPPATDVSSPAAQPVAAPARRRARSRAAPAEALASDGEAATAAPTADDTERESRVDGTEGESRADAERGPGTDDVETRPRRTRSRRPAATGDAAAGAGEVAAPGASDVPPEPAGGAASAGSRDDVDELLPGERPPLPDDAE